VELSERPVQMLERIGDAAVERVQARPHGRLLVRVPSPAGPLFFFDFTLRVSTLL
jgi:hypothetical protein